MNDELSGQLTADWRIPAYAQKMLWLSGTGDNVQGVRTEGDTGLFELQRPAPIVTIRWGAADGIPLAQLRWRIDNLEWNGSVRIGGFIASMHLMDFAPLDMPLVVLHIDGQPLKPETQPYTSASQRSQWPYAAPDFHAGIDETSAADTTTWLVSYDSPLAALAQDAMSGKALIYAYGRLPDEARGWHQVFALPILLDAMTVFAG